jgi:polysaccharide biosynthesis/export protein
MVLRSHDLIHRFVPVTMLIYAAEMAIFPAIALSQVLSVPYPFSTPNSAPNSLPSSPTRSLLEDARQRLIDRGELSPSEFPNAPGNPVAQPPSSEAEFDSYRLEAGDTIYVNVLRFADLSFQGTLDLEGNLLIPLAGALSLKGLTPQQARAAIQTALDRYVVNPQVDVILIAQRSVQVTILGEIVRPGLYPLQAPQLSTALISAGGATRLADLRSVRIRRTLDDGSVVERNVDLFTPLRDAQAVPDVRLSDGDTIIVPTLTAEADPGYDRDLIARSTLAQAQITIKVLNYATGGGGGRIGSLQLPNGSNFIDALASISPDLGSADIHNIALVRYDVQQGKAVTQELDGKHAIMGDQSQNPILEQNDVIVIGRNFVAQLTHTLNTFTQPFRDVLGFLLFFDSLSKSADNLFKPSGTTR